MTNGETRGLGEKKIKGLGDKEIGKKNVN